MPNRFFGSSARSLWIRGAARFCSAAMLLALAPPLAQSAAPCVGILCHGERRNNEGIYLALQSAAEIGETRYVDTLAPAGLQGLDALIVPPAPDGRMLAAGRETLRQWVAEGHGVMLLHDAVGYRKHSVLFPEIARGVGNPFNRETGYGTECIVTIQHPAVRGFEPPALVEHAYYDQVVMERGPEGVVLAREAIVLDAELRGGGEPVIVAGTLGKGRVVANGLLVGFDETVKPKAPKGAEQKLLIGLVQWLAGAGDHPQKNDLGPDVKVTRSRATEGGAGEQDVWQKIAGIQNQALEPWSGEWGRSAKPAPAPVAISRFRTPIEFPEAGLRPSGYTPVADGWVRVDLRDEWKCRPIPNSEANPADDEGTRQAFFQPEHDDHAWTNQPVPAESRRTDTKETGIIWYRRSAVLPPLKAGQRVLLSFTRCGIETKAWVNGKYAGMRVGGTTPFEFDVTDMARGGETNLVALRVYDIRKPNASYTLPDGQVCMKRPYYVSAGHLWGEAALTVKPELYSVRTLITPRLASSEIEVDAWLFNPGPERKVSLALCVAPVPPPLAKGAGAPSSAAAGSVSLAPGVQRLAFRVPMNQPIPWTTDNPFLYSLEIRNGPDVLARERFGFREFRTDGPHFLLNGKKINLIANVVSGGTLDLSRRIEIDNEGLFLSRYLLAMQGFNANTLYTMGGPHPRQMYDLCDELGLLVYADWNAAGAYYVNPAMIEGWNQGEREMQVWAAELYNHPALVMWSLGAELFERYTPKPYSGFNELLNPAYDAMQALDRQGRPICSSSGRGVWLDPDAKTDVNDFHAYPGNIAGSWTEEAGMIRSIWSYSLGHKPAVPVIQFEMDGGRQWNEDRKAVETLLQAERENGRIDRAKLIELFQQKPYRMGLPWISSLYGFRRYAAEAARGDGWREGASGQIYVRKNVGQASRIAGPLLAGYAPNAETFNLMDITVTGEVSQTTRGWLHTRLGKGWAITDDLAEKRFIEAEGYLTWQRVNNPTLICMDRFDRNVFAGGVVTARVYAINDVDAQSAPWTARCVVRDETGRALDDRAADVGRIGGFKRRMLPWTYAVPPDLPTGFYRVDMYLSAGERIVSDNYESFFVLGQADAMQRVTPAAGRRLALYDSRDRKYKTGIRTKDVLDSLQTPCTEITDFASIAEFDVLIVGADSMDEQVRAAGDALKDWISSGGRLLQFEQHVGGTIPYWRQLRLISAKPHILAEIIEANHPVFRSMDYRHMELWNDLPDLRTPGEVYRMLLGPLNEDMLATGAIGVPRESAQNNQMAVTETIIGKGRLVMSQMEATQRYGADPLASRLIWNLLDYILSDSLWPAATSGDAP